MCRQCSLKEVLEQHVGHQVDNEEYQQKVQLFFSPSSVGTSSSSSTSSLLPQSPSDNHGHPLEPSLSSNLPPPPPDALISNPPTTNSTSTSTIVASATAVGVVAVREVGMGGVPPHWHPIYALTDPQEDVVVVTFDTNRPCDF